MEKTAKTEKKTSAENKKRARSGEADTVADSDQPDKMPRTSHSPPRGRRNLTSGEPPLSETTLRLILGEMETRMTGRIDAMGADIKRNQDDIKDVRKMVGQTETNLLAKIDEQRKQLESMIKSGGTGTPNTSRVSQKNEDSYWLHRRSLSVWPVVGDDASAGVKEFLRTKLKFSEEQITALGRVSVRWIKEPISKARREVFCIFETKETRDKIKAEGKKLAGQGSDVGLRAQFPGFLMDTFRLLEGIAYHLRAGDDSIRRSVKFDDVAMDLVMDVKIGDEWKRIKPAEARATVEKNPHLKRGPSELNSDDLSGLLAKNKNATPATEANASPMHQ